MRSLCDTSIHMASCRNQTPDPWILSLLPHLLGHVLQIRDYKTPKYFLNEFRTLSAAKVPSENDHK